MQSTDSLIRTKLRQPYVRPGLVLRPRLQERILEGLSGPVTLLIAPAGFGKTTLVSACISGVAARVAWLSLDRDDNQVERFLSYLIAALNEADGAIGAKAQQLTTAAPPVAPFRILTSLINDLEADRQEIILVLDDYHFISSQAVHDAVTFLLEHCPANFHLLIATRSDPPLPLTRLRARAHAVELRTSELRFSMAEASLFLNEVMGLNLNEELVTILEERTEGWIAGLQMAALSMRDRKDRAGFIEGFSGTNRYILDYLLQEVLASQPPGIQRFLLHTSILERLSPGLCDALLGSGEEKSAQVSHPSSASQSVKILALLERANLFLVPLDDERRWYRYHHLFADLLQNQLIKSVGDQQVARLHLRASEWFEQNHLPVDAIQHASLAGDIERIERIIENHYLEMMNRGEMALIRLWMGKLSREVVCHRPWLCLYEAFSRSWFGQLDEAQLLLDTAFHAIQSGPGDADTQAMLAYRNYVQSRLTAMRGDTSRAIDLCRIARENIPADNLGLQIEIGITYGYEFFLSGDFQNASRILLEMIHACFAVRAVNNPVAAYALLARAEAVQGRLREGYEYFQKAAQWIHAAGGQYLGAIGLVKVGSAGFLYEWNDLEGALEHVQLGLEYLPWWGKADDQVLAELTLARIQMARGKLTEAAATIEKITKMVETTGLFSEARSALETALVRFWLAQNNESQVERWLYEVDRRLPPADLARYEDEPLHLARARVWIARRQPERALAILTILEESARSAGRFGSLVEILILKTLALQEAGQQQHTSQTLGECLALAKPGGFTRTFLDEGQPMQILLARWLAHEADNPYREDAVKLLALFESECPVTRPLQKQAPGGRDLAEPLSQRELEVLHLMALGWTNQQIANQLVVSPGTIKAHAASIYRKLDAANRTEAVARARQLGILN